MLTTAASKVTALAFFRFIVVFQNLRMGEDEILLSNVKECPTFSTYIVPVNTVLRKSLNTLKH